MRTFKFKAVSVAISMALALALPFGVMAADGFGDGAATEDTWDDASEVDAIVSWDNDESNEDFLDDSLFSDDFGFGADAFVSDQAPAMLLDEDSIKFYWKDPNGKADFLVEYDVKSADGKVEHKTATAIIDPTEKGQIDATCEEPAKFKMVVDLAPYIYEKRADHLFESAYFEDPAKPAKGHTWTSVIKQDQGTGASCTKESCPCEGGSLVDVIQMCTVCGKYNDQPGQNKTAVENIDDAKVVEQYTRKYTDHSWGEAVTVYLDDNKDEVVAANATEKTWVVTYWLCQNEGCNHVKYDIKRNSSLDFDKYDYKTDTNAGKNVAYIPTEYVDYPLTNDQYNDILLKDCTKAGEIKALFMNYEKKEQVAIDQTKGLTADTKSYVVFDIPQGDPSEITVPVPAHHTYKYKYVMKDKDLAAADPSKYVEILDKDGNSATAINGLYGLNTSIGKSKYCIDFEVEVIKTTDCANAQTNHETKKQIETSEGVVVAKALPNGAHLYNTKLTKEAKNLAFDTVPKYKDQSITFAQLKALKANSKNTVVTDDVTDCTKGGKGTVAYRCELCGQTIASTEVSFTIKPEKEHKYTQLEMTEVVEPTCTTEGSYIPVMTCENCGIKTTGTKQIIAKVPHKYDGVSTAKINVDGQIVVGDYWGSTSDFSVGKSFKLGNNVLIDRNAVCVGFGSNYNRTQVVPGARITLTRKCTVCGQDIAIEAANIKSLKATVVAITKEGADGVYCKEGNITLKIEGTPDDGEKSLDPVSEEVTLRYYSSVQEYNARYAAHTPGEVVKSNEVEPTEEAEGGYDETISCIFCDKIISQRHVTIPALGHTHSMVAVEAKEATCTEAGNVAYYECQKCGLKYKTEAGELEDQLTDEEVVIPAIGHEIELVEAKEPTCVDGHAAYYVCHNCGEIFKDAEGKEPISYDEVKIEATEEHTPAEPVVEQREDGVYSIVYCDRCGIELSAEPYKGEAVELLEGPKTFNLKANKPNAGYMEFKLGEVEGAEKYRVSYRIAGTKPYTRQESDTNVVKITDLERGQVYDFTACAGDVLEDGQIQWGARALRKDGAVKYARRWYETVEQSKIAKKGTVITLEWTFLNDASKYEISIADNKEMKNAVTVDAAMFSPQIVGDKVQVSADITALPGFDSVPAGSQIKFYVRIRPYTMYDEKDVAGGVSNLRAKTIKF